MTKQFIIYGIFLLFHTSLLAQIDWKCNTNFSTGYTNNIYLAPSEYQLTDTSSILDYRINRCYNRLSCSNDFKYTLKKRHSLLLNTLIQPKIVWREKNANAHIYQAEFGYEYRGKKLNFNQNFILDKERKLTIDVLNDDGISAYDYILKQSSSYLKYRFRPTFFIDYTFSTGHKAYQLMPSGKDFTHVFQTHHFTGNLSWKKVNFLQVGFRFHQQYFSSIYVDQTTTRINWRYMTTNALYKWKKDKDNYIICQAIWMYKSDFRKSDYSFHQITFSVTGETKFSKTGLTGGINYVHRFYLDRVAYNYQNPNMLLRYHYIGGNIGFKYYLAHAIEVTAGISGELRFTNSNRLDRKYRRPYETSGFYISISHSFKSKITPRKTQK